ncbi:unnamed protein product [Moneuplotes crassus]|uniref:Uncharacterized protein n=1 Tax=Euplotes crassus TaxID=5936 RepID=A0AAD2CYZ1_EUPCR|nr:unnamed protein product [Moneuplotes crassus]
MSVKVFTESIQEANRYYNMAEMNEKEGSEEEAKNLYQKAAEAYQNISKMCRDGATDDFGSEESLIAIADSCRRKMEVINLKKELLPSQETARKKAVKSNIAESVLGASRIGGPKYTILSQSMAQRDAEETNAVAQEEFEKIKNKLSGMNKKIKKMLDSIMESVLKLESLYNQDIRKILDDNPFDTKSINLKNVDKAMGSMKKYVAKVIKAANSNFQSEISLMSSSILSSSTQETISHRVFKKDDNVEGLPPGITLEEMDYYLNLVDPPLYIPYKRYEKLEKAYKKAKDKYKAKSQKLRELEYKENSLTQEIAELKKGLRISTIQSMK